MLILAVPFPPQPMAGVFRTLRFVKYLRESGWEPIVLTAHPGLGGHAPLDASLGRHIPTGVVVERAPIWQPAKRLRALVRGSGRGGTPAAPQRTGPRSRAGVATALNRILAALLETPDTSVGWIPPAIAAARRLLMRHDPSVIFSTSPPPSSHLAALALHHLTRRPVVLDFRDPWADDRGKRSRGKAAQQLERRCIECASRVILNTPRLLKDFDRRYPDAKPGKFVVVPNGFDPELLAEISSRLPSPTRPAVTKLCHPGTVYGGRDLLPVVNALERLVGAGIDVTLDQVGTVARDKLPVLQRVVRERGLEARIRLHGRVSHGETLRRMSEADLFLVSQPRWPLQVPGKLYEMLLFRKPILALTGSGATADLVLKFGVGAVVDPDDPAAIARAIEGLARAAPPDPARWEPALAAHDGRKLTAQLAGLLDEVCVPLA